MERVETVSLVFSTQVEIKIMIVFNAKEKLKISYKKSSNISERWVSENGEMTGWTAYVF